MPRFVSDVRILTEFINKKGIIMNYLEWSLEYFDTAAEIANVIEKLKNKRKNANLSVKKDLDLKITKYKTYYNECVMTANILMKRHKGVA